MPGKASLLAQEYYAHPRNAFWKIACALLDVDARADYARLTLALKFNQIALWDVMQSCTRESSLDSDIVEDSIVPNDFRGFFDAHPGVQRIFFNGAKAEHAYRKYVIPDFGEAFREMCYQRLPSTSPAHAGMSYAGKLEKWCAIVS